MRAYSLFLRIFSKSWSLGDLQYFMSVVFHCTQVPYGGPSGDLSEPEHEGPFEADACFQRSYIEDDAA